MGNSLCSGLCNKALRDSEDVSAKSISFEYRPAFEGLHCETERVEEELYLEELSPILTKVESSGNTSCNHDLTLLRNRVVYEGQIYRWKDPAKMVLRWCQLTRNGFKLYRSQLAAVTQERPLLSVPHDMIGNIKRYTSVSVLPTKDCAFYRVVFLLKTPISTASSPNQSHLSVKRLTSSPKLQPSPFTLSRIIPIRNEKFRKLKKPASSLENLSLETGTANSLMFALKDREAFEAWQESFNIHLARMK